MDPKTWCPMVPPKLWPWEGLGLMLCEVRTAHLILFRSLLPAMECVLMLMESTGFLSLFQKSCLAVCRIDKRTMRSKTLPRYGISVPWHSFRYALESSYRSARSAEVGVELATRQVITLPPSWRCPVRRRIASWKEKWLLAATPLSWQARPRQCRPRF